FASLVQMRAEGLLVTGETALNAHRVQIATLAARHAVPTISTGRLFAEAGGLMSYGPNSGERERQAGIYVGRILKGAKPAAFAVVHPPRFELIINLQTADVLGIDVPAILLAQATEVIE